MKGPGLLRTGERLLRLTFSEGPVTWSWGTAPSVGSPPVTCLATGILKPILENWGKRFRTDSFGLCSLCCSPGMIVLCYLAHVTLANRSTKYDMNTMGRICFCTSKIRQSCWWSHFHWTFFENARTSSVTLRERFSSLRTAYTTTKNLLNRTSR